MPKVQLPEPSPGDALELPAQQTPLNAVATIIGSVTAARIICES